MEIMISLSAKAEKAARIQSGVVPYRIKGGEIEILMIKTKHANNWGLPKGGLEPDLSLIESALKEADEEAGAIGRPGMVIGQSEYVKGSTGRRQHVTWYLMHVTKLKQDYMEVNQRDRKWFSVDKAVSKIDKGFLPILMKGLKLLAKHS
ncbi:nudix hydrolase [Yersinia phage fHe-Yen9-02]|nr:nudix hydrolase [Yersinia phage fHe-Yen9-02]